jgi:hypothetical protein
MYWLFIISFVPLALVTINFTLYWPGAKYVTAGFFKNEIVPFPRSHFQFVGLPVDRSVKFTRKGAQPDIGVAEKFAVSCALEINAWESKIINRSHLQITALRTTIGLLGFYNDAWTDRLPSHLLITENPLKNCMKQVIFSRCEKPKILSMAEYKELLP